jgi:hypothetical protein
LLQRVVGTATVVKANQRFDRADVSLHKPKDMSGAMREAKSASDFTCLMQARRRPV